MKPGWADAERDTACWTKALEEYRKRSGDTRKPNEMPALVLSSILQRAQQLKKEAA